MSGAKIQYLWFWMLNRTLHMASLFFFFFLMNSGLFVLKCQRIRRLTAGYEHIIMVSQQVGAKLSPSVLRRLLNCCPMALRHLPVPNVP